MKKKEKEKGRRVEFFRVLLKTGLSLTCVNLIKERVNLKVLSTFFQG